MLTQSSQTSHDLRLYEQSIPFLESTSSFTLGWSHNASYRITLSIDLLWLIRDRLVLTFNLRAFCKTKPSHPKPRINIRGSIRRWAHLNQALERESRCIRSIWNMASRPTVAYSLSIATASQLRPNQDLIPLCAACRVVAEPHVGSDLNGLSI